MAMYGGFPAALNAARILDEAAAELDKAAP
jgi:hypothetical protein